jgi:hypothetical protein
MQLLGTSRAERAVAIVTVALVALGLALRTRGFLFGIEPLWWDEASWALELIEHRWHDDAIRPVGFMVVTRALCWLFSPSESVLRSLPWIFGMATTVIAPFLAKRLYSGAAARLLFVAVLTLHPAAIDLSKEFKPYSVSLGLHVGLLFLTLRYLSMHRAKDLFVTLLVAGIGTLFAQDLVFAFPGTFLLLALEAYRHRRNHLGWIVGSGGLTVLVLLLQYWLVWSRIPASDSDFWGKKYGVFHTVYSQQSYLAWFLDKYRDLREFPGYRRIYWSSSVLSDGALTLLQRLDGLFWSLAHALGLGFMLFRRRFREVALLVVPLLTWWAFNVLDLWPMGVFRANLFVLCYLAAIACAAFDWELRERFAWFAPAVALLVLIPLCFFETDWHATKRAECNGGSLPPALARLRGFRHAEKKRGRETVLFSTGACTQWEYYSEVHPSKDSLHQKLDPLFDARCSRKEQMPRDLTIGTRHGRRAWVVLDRRRDVDKLAVGKDGQTLDIVEERAIGSLRIVAFRRHRAGDDS